MFTMFVSIPDVIYNIHQYFLGLQLITDLTIQDLNLSLMIKSAILQDMTEESTFIIWYLCTVRS